MAIMRIVVIPDLWGKFSDTEAGRVGECHIVVIPDLWGKFSDDSF